MDRYKKELTNTASKFDALTESCGEITKLISAIIDENDNGSTIILLKRISAIVDSSEYSKSIKQVAAVLKNCLISYYGHEKLLEICNQEKRNKEEDNRSLSQLLEELNALVGLESVKEKVNDLITWL